MPANRKPRKRHQPIAMHTHPIETTIALASKLRPTQQQDLQAPLLAAFHRLRCGPGGWEAWCAMADGTNVAQALAQRGICADRLPEIELAQRVLQQVHARYQRRQSWTLCAPELQALDDAVFFHGVQLQHCSQGELRDAIAAVKRTVSQALAGNAAPDAHLCVGVLGQAPKTAAQPPTEEATA